MLSPAWLAVMLQLPAAVRCTSAPVTVQSPDAAYATSSVEDAVAETEKSASP